MSIQAVSPLLTMAAICSTLGALIRLVATAAAVSVAAGAGAGNAAEAVAAASWAKAAVAAMSVEPSAPAPQSSLRIICFPSCRLRGSERGIAGFAGANARGGSKFKDEYLAVADCLGAGDLLDRLDHLRRKIVGRGYLDLHLG